MLMQYKHIMHMYKCVIVQAIQFKNGNGSK